eukprot:m.237642 g.237642  ORF g.237642 m.237642 type:complete len:363 (+) comp21262_c0_seq1:1841-2929(+)
MLVKLAEGCNRGHRGTGAGHPHDRSRRVHFQVDVCSKRELAVDGGKECCKIGDGFLIAGRAVEWEDVGEKRLGNSEEHRHRHDEVNNAHREVGLIDIILVHGQATVANEHGKEQGHAGKHCQHHQHGEKKKIISMVKDAETTSKCQVGWVEDHNMPWKRQCLKKGPEKAHKHKTVAHSQTGRLDGRRGKGELGGDQQRVHKNTLADKGENSHSPRKDHAGDTKPRCSWTRWLLRRVFHLQDGAGLVGWVERCARLKKHKRGKRHEDGSKHKAGARKLKSNIVACQNIQRESKIREEISKSPSANHEDKRDGLWEAQGELFQQRKIAVERCEASQSSRHIQKQRSRNHQTPCCWRIYSRRSIH